MTNGVCHYIPHHAVLKDSTTTPLRIVYDCSFKQGEQPSLNDCLQAGPPFLNDLTGILLRFRLHKYAITTDIETAFLHVNLDQADRDATRFYCLSKTDDPESEFIVYRFKSVMFGATSPPFISNCHPQQTPHAVYRPSQHGYAKESVRGRPRLRNKR